jgi:hypothetical protein
MQETQPGKRHSRLVERSIYLGVAVIHACLP